MAFTVGPAIIAASQREREAHYADLMSIAGSGGVSSSGGGGGGGGGGGRGIGEALGSIIGRNKERKAEFIRMKKLGEGMGLDKDEMEVMGYDELAGTLAAEEEKRAIKKAETDIAATEQKTDYYKYLIGEKQAATERSEQTRGIYEQYISGVSRAEGLAEGIGTGVMTPEAEARYTSIDFAGAMRDPGVGRAVDIYQQTGQVMDPALAERYLGTAGAVPGAGMDPGERLQQVPVPGRPGEFMTLDLATGKFIDPKQYTPEKEFEPRAIDIDGDGVPDVYTTSPGSVALLPQKGDAEYEAQSPAGKAVMDARYFADKGDMEGAKLALEAAKTRKDSDVEIIKEQTGTDQFGEPIYGHKFYEIYTDDKGKKQAREISGGPVPPVSQDEYTDLREKIKSSL